MDGSNKVDYRDARDALHYRGNCSRNLPRIFFSSSLYDQDSRFKIQENELLGTVLRTLLGVDPRFTIDLQRYTKNSFLVRNASKMVQIDRAERGNYGIFELIHQANLPLFRAMRSA